MFDLHACDVEVVQFAVRTPMLSLYALEHSLVYFCLLRALNDFDRTCGYGL
jgi:hypothetical protein